MNKLLLSNNKYLVWDEYGAPNGEPVFYFHGALGSRLEAETADSIAEDLGIRLIISDRPGYGDSDPQDNFELLDWPDMILQLANKLNINKFSIIGFSLGSNFALACAHCIPDRLLSISLIASLAPYETEVMQKHISADFKPLYDLALTNKEAALQQVSQMATSPEDIYTSVYSSLSECDKTLFDIEHIQTHYKKSLTLAFKNGVLGLINDLQNITRPWQFDLDNIELPIDVWHGRDDASVGYAIGEYVSRKLKNSSFHPQDNSGHYFIFDKWNDILKSLKLRAPLT